MKLLSISNKKTTVKKTILVILSFVLVFSGVTGVYVANKKDTANAVSATDFNDGNIISDEIFYDKDAMSVSDIQSFLNKLIPSCRTWNNTTFPAGDGVVVGPPFVCLNNYYENPDTGETSFERGGGAFPGGISSSQIIYNAAQQYGVNPQVLLVMLKKESLGPLTADNWPTKYQYKFAMGYACPDSGPGNSANCDPSKSGFYKQMMRAAWQFKYYKDHPNDYRYHTGWNDIQYSPDASCGTKRVYIENIATLSLYIYTPYVPNAAALANYPGTASCGAYGNRNFFMFFNDWFGSTQSTPKPLTSIGSNILSTNRALSSGDFITSPNGQYILVMQYSGILSLYRWGVLVWQSDNSSLLNSGARLAIQSDGNLVIYDRNNTALWSTNTSGSSATNLTLQDDGNIVIYGTSGAVWASGTVSPVSPAVFRGDSITEKNTLQRNEFLRSPDWRYFLYMQPDGNLVLYTSGLGQAIWASGTSGSSGKYVTMQTDGNLVMYGDRGAIWASGTVGSGTNKLSLQSDGNLVIYNTRTQAIWASGTSGSSGKYVTMQTDGNLVMYGDRGAIWASGTVGGAQTTEPLCDGTSSLKQGEAITREASLCSDNKRLQLLMQTDGNLVIYKKTSTPSWATSSTGKFIKSNLRL